MLHYSRDLFTLAMREFLVTDRKTREKLRNFRKVGKNDIVIGDRAYGTISGITYLKQRGADYVLRIKSNGFTIYNGKKQKTDLLKRLSTLQEGKTADIPAYCIIDDRYEPVRLCVMSKDSESERAGLKRLKKENQRKHGGKPVTELQEESNKYIIVATSLGKEASAAEILGLWTIPQLVYKVKQLSLNNNH